MKKIAEMFSAESVIGKLCLVGFLAPIIAGIIRFNISQKADQSFYVLTGYDAWEVWLYISSLVWFFVAICRSSFTTRCPKCASAKLSKTGKREVGRYEGKITEMLEGDRKGIQYESYDVPATFIKTAFSFECHSCQNVWETIRDIPDQSSDSP